MFEWLKKYNKIFVTGPHRSGTRICSKMIAKDVKYIHIDEIDFEMDSLYQFSKIIRNNKIVVQCPAMCRHIHMYGDKDTAVIMMRRNIQEIVQSQKRIGFPYEQIELFKYDKKDGNIAELKYHFWENHQKAKILNPFDIIYNSLRDHSMWIDKTARNDFWPIQTHSKKDLGFSQNSEFSKILHNDIIILAKKNSSVHLLNTTAEFIWTLCESLQTFNGILTALETKFTNIKKSDLKNDLTDILKMMIKNGLIKITGERKKTTI